MDRSIQLAAEILGHIASQAGNAEILTLRLVSRQMSASAEDAFITRFFPNRIHLYTKFSLQALVNISHSEALKRHVKRVEIRVPKSSFRNPPPRVLPRSGYMPCRHNLVRPAQKRHAEGLCLGLLTEALRSFACASSMPTLSFQDYFPADSELYDPPPYGEATALRQIVQARSTHTNQPSLSGAGLETSIGLCVVAMVEAQQPVKALELGTRFQDSEGVHSLMRVIAEFPCRCFDVPFSSFTVPFASLVSLSIILDPVDDLWEESDGGRALGKVLSLTPALRSLGLTVLSCPFNLDNNRIHGPPEMVDAENLLECLERLKFDTFTLLGPVRIQRDDLKGILRSLQPHLRRLTLRNLELDHTDSWRHFFAWAAGSLKLEHVELVLNMLNTGSSVVDRLTECPPSIGASRHVFESRRAVAEGLAGLVRSTAFAPSE